MKIKLAFVACTTIALIACTPSPKVIETYPFCAETTFAQDCIDVADPVAQTGWLVTSDGTTQGPINYWLDGTIEHH